MGGGVAEIRGYIIRKFSTKTVTTLPFMNARMLRLSSSNSIKHVHLKRVYDKVKVYTGGWGKPILKYHMIDRLSRISKFNDKQKVKDNI